MRTQGRSAPASSTGARTRGRSGPAANRGSAASDVESSGPERRRVERERRSRDGARAPPSDGGASAPSAGDARRDRRDRPFDSGDRSHGAAAARNRLRGRDLPPTTEPPSTTPSESPTATGTEPAAAPAAVEPPAPSPPPFRSEADGRGRSRLLGPRRVEALRRAGRRRLDWKASGVRRRLQEQKGAGEHTLRGRPRRPRSPAHAARRAHSRSGRWVRRVEMEPASGRASGPHVLGAPAPRGRESVPGRAVESRTAVRAELRGPVRGLRRVELLRRFFDSDRSRERVEPAFRGSLHHASGSISAARARRGWSPSRPATSFFSAGATWKRPT